MIYTVTINPALDVNIDCDEVIRPTTIRTKQERRHAGGKGIDVSRVVRNLGGTSVAMGFLGGFTGESIEGLLLEEGLELDFVSIAEETRTNVILSAPTETSADKQDHRFNSLGPKVQPVESSKLFAKIKGLSAASPERRPTHAAICGSLARDMKPQYYVNIIRYFKNLGAKVWVDSSGKAIKESLRYPPRPDVVKPNLPEFDELIGHRLSDSFKAQHRTSESTEEFLHRLVQEEDCETPGDFWRQLSYESRTFFSTYPGVSALIVTLGPHGILLMKDDKVHHGMFNPPPDFKVVSTVGAGDTALATFLWALETGRSWEESLVYAVAASSSAVTKPGTVAPDREDVLGYVKHVHVHEHQFEATASDSLDVASATHLERPLTPVLVTSASEWAGADRRIKERRSAGTVQYPNDRRSRDRGKSA